jgi:phenylacetaldehyde dehydrogenase
MPISTPNRANGAPPISAGLSEGLPQYVQDFVRKPRRLLIDGEWVEAASGKTFQTLDPATEERLGWVAHGGAQDIELAVGALVGALTTSARTGGG